MWHCHYERHLSWDMSSVFIVKNGGKPEMSVREPPPALPPCNTRTQMGID